MKKNELKGQVTAHSREQMCVPSDGEQDFGRRRNVKGRKGKMMPSTGNKANSGGRNLVTCQSEGIITNHYESVLYLVVAIELALPK